VASWHAPPLCAPFNFGLKIVQIFCCRKILSKNAKFGGWKPILEKFRSKIEISARVISSVRNLQLSVGKLLLRAPRSFVTDDAAARQLIPAALSLPVDHQACDRHV